MSSANSPSATVNPGHRHKHITIHGLSHIQLSSRRQPPSSATLLQTSNHYSVLSIHTLPILDTYAKTVPTEVLLVEAQGNKEGGTEVGEEVKVEEIMMMKNLTKKKMMIILNIDMVADIVEEAIMMRGWEN